jgi:hypothetical protein
MDATTPVGMWLDAVYAAYADAPHQVLDQLNRQMVIKEAMVDPEGARETWGRRPEHIAMAGQLGRGPGAEAGPTAGRAPQQQPPGPRRRPPMPTGRPAMPGQRPRPR